MSLYDIDDLVLVCISYYKSRCHTTNGFYLVMSALNLRYATVADEVPLRRLAALDSARVPAPPVLLGDVDGELRAALSLADGHVVADPFAHTADVVAMLQARAAQIRASAARHHRARSGSPLPRVA
jgi:hypothetical protein